MRKNKGKEYSYKYSGDIKELVLKLTSEQYNHNYLVNYYNDYSFSIQVDYIPHRYGVWYKANIERKDGKYIIKGIFVTEPQKNIYDIISDISSFILVSILLIFLWPFKLVSWIKGKKENNPFEATNSKRKRLDYFMINYLGCKKEK